MKKRVTLIYFEDFEENLSDDECLRQTLIFAASFAIYNPDHFHCTVDLFDEEDVCPLCNSIEVYKRHQDADRASVGLETDWRECDECGHQFDIG